mmetsp:Transcript_17517/g.24844  ORF Transcript_17517/g.24844 Transcript_17517/m.24844 type:complete len:581 (+) Transcript_17517:165-1907(+)|eukprot:CAMPEP_0201699598 /NCGR_PEP_ID=MMETSP0578-20130828/24702_1 /ASSEMBLY_ACC=CAM_ASM_000663 /TAXON_ID=267565 /ORGANISM="Skeletonema grethea, Strain CCMP 1804" /LENGTH=580 /DNA_ID=CAMNT_0048186405 /DNA_START=70 /DNA_END=1812 /DNA_ORIENTATION=-
MSGSMLRSGSAATPWRSILQASKSSKSIFSRSMGFKPRRTPPPSIAGVNLAPRSDPSSSLKGGSKKQELLGGQGRDPNWTSPHHTDYYGKVDTSTMDHPHLLHGDPHMPIQRLSRGGGMVVLDHENGKRAREISDYRDLNRKELLTDLVKDDEDNTDNNNALEDELDREFGSVAAEAIRSHLNDLHSKLHSSKDDVYSPLDEIEQKFRTIDRITAAPGSTQDLALQRRARAESREYFRVGSIPELKEEMDLDDMLAAAAAEGDKNDGDGIMSSLAEMNEVGKGRGYDAESVFGKNAKIPFPYGKDFPSPTYHPDFPQGSNVGNNPNDPEEEAWVKELEKLIYEEQYTEMGLGEIDSMSPVNIQKEDMDAYMKEKQRTKQFNILERDNEHEKDREEKEDEILEMIKNGDDPNQEAFGPWGECTIKVDRVQKVERGGTTVRYRALVIGGNGNGAAGFGIGKALSPNEAIVKACKHCKRNVFYVDRYLNTGLSYDLAGKHNSCKVQLRAVRPDYGLHGHPLICEILKYAGITDATSKSHGNRNPYNVVYATFKALMTHESLEEIALKRGKKLLNLQRARRLGI